MAIVWGVNSEITGDYRMRKQFCLLLIAATLYTEPYACADQPIGPDEGRPHVRSEEASAVLGQLAFVSGKVSSVGQARGLSFLNLGENAQAPFAGVIYDSNLGNFKEPLTKYEGKFVSIRGFVSEYRGRPEINISNPAQIEILSKASDTVTQVPRREIRAAGFFTMATFNVLNLFDADDDVYHADETTPAKPRPELENLARTIRQLDADIIAMQEVEDRGYLERFLNVFLKDMGYEVVHFEGNDLRGIDVCLVSRLPVGRVVSHRHVQFPGPDGKPRRFSRDLLSVRLHPPNSNFLDIWVVHLKSNSDGREFAEPIRLAEAVELRKLLDEELAINPAARIIVAGDFNDTWQSATLTTIIGTGKNALWSASQDARRADLVTYNQQPHLEMIDFILCSPAVAKRYQKNSFAIEPGSPESSGSDHNPVVARFELPTDTSESQARGAGSSPR
jgi:endonuclease/exonuclease/phosphatase family metal-dependent hydrolase